MSLDGTDYLRSISKQLQIRWGLLAFSIRGRGPRSLSAEKNDLSCSNILIRWGGLESQKTLVPNKKVSTIYLRLTPWSFLD